MDVIYAKQLSDEKTLIGKMLNSLIKKLNEVKHLPRYIVIIFDKELIVDGQIFNFGARETYEYALRWFVNNVACMIDTRKDDIRKKRPGALSPGSEPRFIWVEALSRPEVLLAKCVYSLICKFNAALEEVVAEERHSHVLKVEVQINNSNFDRLGSLTPIGQIEYWNSLDSQLKDFDQRKTELLPAGVLPRANKAKDRNDSHRRSSSSLCSSQDQSKEHYNHYKWFRKDKC